ncbi:hypothetical protein SEA_WILLIAMBOONE_188 [Gordonia phage WilliamBoone]|nr:hypothetical protein SEA_WILLIAMBOONE_188 [Gordonia phage WilliamBoone]
MPRGTCTTNHCENCSTRIGAGSDLCSQCSGYFDIGTSPMLWD